jgi:hypothetical protein
VVTVRCSGGEGGEDHLHSALEIPPWHGEAVPARPRRHRARGSRRQYVDEAPANQAHISPWTRPSNSVASSRSPWPRSRASEAKGMQATRKQSGRSRGQAEPPLLDLSIERHLSGGDRRSSSESSTAAARRHSRQGSRGGEGDASERVGRGDRSDRPSRWSGSTSRLVRQVGLARQVGQGWQRER